MIRSGKKKESIFPHHAKVFFSAALTAGCLLAFAAAQQLPTATKTWVTDVSHSVVLLHFDSTGTWQHLRVRYVEEPKSCRGGTGGNLELASFPRHTGISSNTTQPVGGLLPQTGYEICPELSDDGKKWYLGASAKFTTLPLPSRHPAVPIPPKRFHTNYPDTSGYETATIAADCHDFVPVLSRALSRQLERGTVINIPAGTVCVGNYSLGQPAADVVRFTNTAVHVANSTITLPHHGYSEGQGIIFGTWYGCLPGSNGALDCGTQGVGSIVPGQLYFAHVVDTNTIQVYSGGPAGASGKLCTFETPGNGTNLIVKWPRPLHWIIIRTATSDAQFDPEHVRISPAWLPKMAVLRTPVSYLGTQNSNVLFHLGDQDGGLMSMNANIRFVGIEFTYPPSPEASLSSNPVPHFELFHTNRFNQNIIFDRCYFHALTKPDRTARAFWWDGMNQAIVDSYIDGLEFYHPFFTGLQLTRTSPTSFSIGPGSYSWGSGSARLEHAVTVQLTGNSGPATRQAFVYYSIPGKLQIALPPGVTGMCSPAPCHVFTSTESPGNGLSGEADHYPNQGTTDNYWIDPVFSASPSCNQKETLFGNWKAPPGVFDPVGAHSLGLAFTSSANGYVCGIRYYRDAAEKGTHTAVLFTLDGKAVSHGVFANETGAGWQEAAFPNPARISAGQKLVASVRVNNGAFASKRFFQNGSADSEHLHAFAQYVNGSGSCNFADAWPKDFVGNNAAAQIGCIQIQNGQIVRLDKAEPYANPWDTEGCQCMIGGVGPGPYAFINNYVEGSGNVWHHDDGGGRWASRGDYFYYRNRFHAPQSEMFGGPESDGLLYGHRQLMEWKAGQRILLEGNVFDGGWVESTPYGELLDFSSRSGDGIRDVDIRNNTFEHAATALLSPTSLGDPKPAPPIRFRFQNNLVWDINGTKFCTHQAGFCTETGGFGAILAGAQGAEDWIIDHNTIAGNTGSEPGFLWITQTRVEGLSATRNIFYLSPGLGEGITADLIGSKNHYCKLLFGKAAADCALVNYIFEGNILTGSEDRWTIRSWWPGLNNYVPPKPNDLSGLGKVIRDPYSGYEEYRPNPAFCDNCGRPSEEWKYAGVDVDKLDRAQGKVKAVNVPAESIDSHSAEIVFTAPDNQACPVDYSESDPAVIRDFVRVKDPVSSDFKRKVSLSHLAAKTTYHYRINCAVEQPRGTFTTR